MDSLRMASVHEEEVFPACCRCGGDHRLWDRIAGRAYCPGCQESLVHGESEPLVERTEPQRCAACSHLGTVCFLTFPMDHPTAVEMDLCPVHLRALLGRRLGPFAYHQLLRQLHGLGYQANDIFLLHDAFYDDLGRALEPIAELE